MSRRLPEIHSLESMRAALTEADELWSAFVWGETQEGHDYWSVQAKSELTEEGRAILESMIALAEAEQAVSA